MPNSLDPDQARHFVRPDLFPNCLQKLSADDTLSGSLPRDGRVAGSIRVVSLSKIH